MLEVGYEGAGKLAPLIFLLIVCTVLLHDVLLRCYFEGWRFQKIGLTTEFSFEDYGERIARRFLATVAVRRSGTLVLELCHFRPEAGDTIINFYLPEVEDKPKLRINTR